MRDRVMEIKVVEGEPGSGDSVAPPTLTRSENIYQIPLWQCLIRSGSTVTLTDERLITYTPTEAIEAFKNLQAETLKKFGELTTEYNKIKNGDTLVKAVYA